MNLLEVSSASPYRNFSVFNLRGTELRHTCEQGDNLDGYTWTEYDAREGGVQVIKDSFNNVKLTTEFLKVAGGDHGGSWAARIKGEPIDQGILDFFGKINKS